ncbi:Uncharacterised protein [Vibrio cholerae]|nr:Uncharacterised protein [Vibrio cholerae]
MVKPQVKSGATSSGQQLITGILSRSTASPCHTISWQGARRKRLTGILSTCLKTGSFSISSFKPRGGSGSLR